MTNAIDARQREMLDSMPPIYDESLEANAVMRANAVEIERKRAEADDLLAQMHVESATWGLDYWDRVLDLAPAPRMPTAERRERVLSRLRGTFPATKKHLTDLLDVHTAGAHIEEFPREYRFEGYMPIEGAGTLNLGAVHKAINEVKPAHLAFSSNALIRDRITVSGKSYSFGVPFPITNCFTTADIKGALSRSTVTVASKSYAFTVDYPITNELMPTGNNLISKSAIVLGVHTDVYFAKFTRAGERLLGQKGLTANPTHYSERPKLGESITGEVIL